MRKLTTVLASAVFVIFYQLFLLFVLGGSPEGLHDSGFAGLIMITGSVIGGSIGLLGLGLSKLFGKSSDNPKAFSAMTALASVLIGVALNFTAAASGGLTSAVSIFALAFDITSVLPLGAFKFLPAAISITVGAACVGALTGFLAAGVTNKLHGSQAA